MQALPSGIGWIEVVCGPMFSGKTEELIRRLRRAVYAKQRVQIFKPEVDARYDAVDIVSHSSQRLQAHPINDAEDIIGLLHDDTEVVGIDEAQFFERNLVDVCQTLAGQARRIVVAGLDQDYRGVPFEPIPELLGVAEFVTKSLAICVVCGNPAGRSQRLLREQGRVMLGAGDAYEPRCRACHSLEEPIVEQPRLFR